MRVFDLKLMSWGDLSELRAYIAEKEGKDPSEINFYRLDGEKLEPYILVRSSLDNYVFRNPAGELYILDPYSMPSSAGGGSSSRGPLREPAEGEIVIRTAEELAKIGRDPSYPYNGSYILMSDIDLEGFDYYGDGTGWAPIGSDSKSFTGTFDGNGFVIRNLYINRPGVSYQGLFGFVYGASISNVALESVNVTGYSNTGGLAGYIRNGSTIANSYSTGSVTGKWMNTGGLVGYTYRHDGIIDSFSTCSVTGGTYSTGGLLGRNESGWVTRCYSTGSVTGNAHVGGLVGLNLSKIIDSYSTASVTGNTRVGGLVGSNTDSEVSWAMITRSYSTGSVSGTSYAGGLVGYNVGSRVTASYWDTITSGLTTSAGGTGRTTAEMKQQSTFVDWDFDTVWQIDEGETYPYLRSNPQSPPPM
ncbi:GLUG motif-containing protein [Koleobacter methoxysyntrophicus]|uniref:GLUG motif-containing protein n=1 Tax=Koleobacter methoxysyntrophicus TaxID=2751313 RepID=UPI001F510728|nr:GLUG motif-containing protein [Koleobacter methoxysyntrophicus]